MQPLAPQLWPVFICYRQTDGLPAARRLHELLDKHETIGPDGERIRLDVYLDQTMAAVADWRELHRPYLEKARALLIVCSPGAKIDEGPDDWVHKEIRWWLEHRTVAPILIDPLRQGLRYVPDEIKERWPEIQRVPLVSSEWANLAPAELEEKSQALRRVVLGVIVPSGKTVWQQELEEARARGDQLRRRLTAVVILLFVAASATAYAFISAKAAQISRRVSEASLQDAQAAASFDEARRYEARVEALRQQRRDNQRQLNEIAAKTADGSPGSALEQNLGYENRQIDEDMLDLGARAAGPRQRGYAQLRLADESWTALTQDGYVEEVAARKRPEPPAVFSLELINAGSGESILIHYGTPDATRLVMLNGGPTSSFRQAVGKRLEALKASRFAGSPTPIELFIASDQDEDKTGGLRMMLRDQAEAQSARNGLVKLRSVWANIFASSGLRGDLRRAIDELEIPWNQPFDHSVMRPERGRAVHRLSDEAGNDLEIVVLGPERERLNELFEHSRRTDERNRTREPLATPITDFPDEQFSRFKDLLQDRGPLPPAPAPSANGQCVPSESAQQQANVTAADTSIPNLASTILLFRYRGKSLLHTGDSRSDLIMKALIDSGLMPQGGRAHVNVLHIPHLGSNRNLTAEFLERVTADEYLFTGDGTHGNPEIETIAALVAARPCARYIMHFVNRDSATEIQHGERVNAFFASENAFNPNYRRFFRSPDGGSVFIDLLDRVTY